MERVSVAEAGAELEALIDRVAGGEEIALTRDGAEVARLVASGSIHPPDYDPVAALRALRSSLAARGVSMSWEELKELRDEDRP